MCASTSDFLRGGGKAPRVAILPDAVFFSRSIPVAAGATRDEVVAQVGLALESLSPFPLAQLYYGYYWPDGADRALAYAAYRRRFTVDQVDAWAGAELVLPAFATLLGASLGPDVTLVLSTPEGLTAVHWEQGPVPSVVLHRPLGAEAGDDERSRARAEIVRAAGGSGRSVEVVLAPEARPGADAAFVFGAGELTSAIPSGVAAALDVRDKGELAMRAKARRRDILIWRVAIGAVAACLVMGLAELALFGAGFWQAARKAKVNAQKPTVVHIMDEQDLAERIGDLSTKRLLPLEMISAVSPEGALPKNPPAIQFLHASTNALNTIQIEAQTNNAGEIAGYKSALEQSPACERVEIRDQRTHDNLVTFTLVVTFKPGALVPATS